MDALRRASEQFLKLYRAMSPSQRLTLVAVPSIVLAAFCLLMSQGSSSSHVPLSWGKVFTRDELMLAEQTLLDAGLNEFYSKGQRLMVPAADVERYNAALLEGGTLPSDWGEELEKQFESDGIFSSDRQQQARKDIALAKELRRIIRAVPDVEDANVIWARSQGRNRWPYRGQTVTATVNVLPRRNRPLAPQLVHSLRMAVANMVPDLRAEDVTVFDQSTGTSYAADKENDALSSRFLTRIKQFEQLHQNKIYAHLSSYIPNVVVTVNVELDNLMRQSETKQTLNSKTVELASEQQTRSDQFSQQPSRAEPGAASNRPLELQTFGSLEKTRTTSETNNSSRSVPQDFTISETELIAAIPKAVQVSVGIPRDYYRKVGMKRASASGTPSGGQAASDELSDEEIQRIELEVQKDVKATVTRLIPTGSPETAVNVTSYTAVEPDIPEVQTPLTETVGRAASRWGGAAGLGLFALWALWMVSRSLSRLPEVDSNTNPLPIVGTPDEDDEPELKKIEPTERDNLQDMVRDNPELAAAVLGRWIQAAK